MQHANILVNPSGSHSHFPHNFNTFIIIIKSLVLIKWSQKSRPPTPSIMLIVEYRMVWDFNIETPNYVDDSILLPIFGPKVGS